eukprot:Polyplicarium_translucidae@DN3258_c1_g1_i2.p1
MLLALVLLWSGAAGRWQLQPCETNGECGGATCVGRTCEAFAASDRVANVCGRGRTCTALGVRGAFDVERPHGWYGLRVATGESCRETEGPVFECAPTSPSECFSVLHVGAEAAAGSHALCGCIGGDSCGEDDFVVPVSVVAVRGFRHRPGAVTRCTVGRHCQAVAAGHLVDAAFVVRGFPDSHVCGGSERSAAGALFSSGSSTWQCTPDARGSQCVIMTGSIAQAGDVVLCGCVAAEEGDCSGSQEFFQSLGVIEVDEARFGRRELISELSQYLKLGNQCVDDSDCSTFNHEVCTGQRCAGWRSDLEDQKTFRCVDGYSCTVAADDLRGFGITSAFRVMAIGPEDVCGTVPAIPDAESLFAKSFWACEEDETGATCKIALGVGKRRDLSVNVEGMRLCGCPDTDSDGSGSACDTVPDFHVPLGVVAVQECITNAHCIDKRFAYCVLDHCAGFAGVGATAGWEMFGCALNQQCTLSFVAQKTLEESLKVVPVTEDISCGADAALDPEYYQTAALPCLFDVNKDGECDISVGLSKDTGGVIAHASAELMCGLEDTTRPPSE